MCGRPASFRTSISVTAVLMTQMSRDAGNGHLDSQNRMRVFIDMYNAKVGRKPSETDSVKSQISPKTSCGEKGQHKKTLIDIACDSQVNSYFQYRWSPASLTFNIYFYLFLYLYITRITINNDTPHLKSPKNQNRRAA